MLHKSPGLVLFRVESSELAGYHVQRAFICQNNPQPPSYLHFIE